MAPVEYTLQHTRGGIYRKKRDKNLITIMHILYQTSKLFILSFLMIVVHRGTASFYLGEMLSREIRSCICGRYSAEFMTFRFDGMLLLNWDFDMYLGAFHRLRMHCYPALEQVDPFLHAENAHPFCGGRFNFLRLYVKAPAIVLDAQDDVRGRSQQPDGRMIGVGVFADIAQGLLNQDRKSVV